VLTNRALEALVATTDEWVVTRTGIRERRIAAPDETTASMCARAAEPSPGDDLLLVSFGGGLAWAAAVLRWVDVEAVIAARPARGRCRAGRFVAAGAC
jgi:3-oxoacyl-[acyl-carrier-protein] synthase III